jgi:predicted nucleotidyltransferase
MSSIFDPETQKFYKEVLQILKDSKLPFSVGGTLAIMEYTGIKRDTKDLDIFCTPGEFQKILSIFAEKGYITQIEDERWLAKIKKEKMFADIIFNSANGILPVHDNWVESSRTAEVFGVKVNLMPIEEVIFSKAFVATREKYHGADVAHMILKNNKEIDWKKLLSYFDQYWEVLLMHVLNFRFIYPSEREKIPKWLLDELLSRLQMQIAGPTSKKKICRGKLFSPTDYVIDITEWDFADLVGFNSQETDRHVNPKH